MALPTALMIAEDLGRLYFAIKCIEILCACYTKGAKW